MKIQKTVNKQHVFHLNFSCLQTEKLNWIKWSYLTAKINSRWVSPQYLVVPVGERCWCCPLLSGWPLLPLGSGHPPHLSEHKCTLISHHMIFMLISVHNASVRFQDFFFYYCFVYFALKKLLHTAYSITKSCMRSFIKNRNVIFWTG